MAPNKLHRKKSADGAMGERDDIVLRVMEAVADERVIQLLQKALYPQMLLDKFAEMNTRIDGLTAQLTAKDNKILRRGLRSWRRARTGLNSILDGRTSCSTDLRKPGTPRTPTAESSRW